MTAVVIVPLVVIMRLVAGVTTFVAGLNVPAGSDFLVLHG
ncbi:MAG: hypothetical protein QOJ76_2874 [Acidobacteriota bacterium]|jgi:hypothetical protein|nr:hypothetical protein [Acidobacteriota bacterium]